MFTYRGSFSTSSLNSDEIVILTDGSDGPRWDNMYAVEKVVARLAPGAMSGIRLPRNVIAAQRAAQPAGWSRALTGQFLPGFLARRL